MRVSGTWLNGQGTQTLMARLEDAGHQVFFVGGCVRNALINQPVEDVDLATDARPETVSYIAETAGFRVVPTGLEHGTVTVIADGRPHEVTTFRRDVETFGRHATVAFSDRIEDDAARRDFTMNALYADRSGRVLDPLGGLPDVQARCVRFVGNAVTRIQEDYLRILRFFRFHALYGDASQGLDADGLAACAELSAGLETISRERIGAEIRKLLAAVDPAPSVAAMAQAGVLSRILPGADHRLLAPLVHLEQGVPPDWLRRLAALGGEDVADRLRLSRAQARELDSLRAAIGNWESPAVLGWRLGLQRGKDAVLLRASVLLQCPADTDMDEVIRGASAQFPIRAADLAPLSGATLGARLKELEQRWIDSDLRADKSQLLG